MSFRLQPQPPRSRPFPPIQARTVQWYTSVEVVASSQSKRHKTLASVDATNSHLLPSSRRPSREKRGRLRAPLQRHINRPENGHVPRVVHESFAYQKSQQAHGGPRRGSYLKRQIPARKRPSGATMPRLSPHMRRPRRHGRAAPSLPSSVSPGSDLFWRVRMPDWAAATMLYCIRSMFLVNSPAHSSAPAELMSHFETRPPETLRQLDSPGHWSHSLN